MCASVSLEVERVVEAFAASRTQVALDVAVALDVPVQQTLQWKRFVADAASELVLGGLDTCKTSNISRTTFAGDIFQVGWLVLMIGNHLEQSSSSILSHTREA